MSPKVVPIERARRPAADPDGRALPSNAVVEAGLLYTLMSAEMTTPEMATTLRMLSAEHFFNPANQRVFGAMKELALDAVTIDKLTVFARVKDVPAPLGGWWRYLTETIPTDGVHAEARPSEYAKILLEKWRGRETIRLCAAAMDRAYDGADAVETIEETRTGLAAVAGTLTDTTASTAHDALADAWKNLASASHPSQRGLSWGFPSCDREFGRFRPGRMTVFAAVPGVGKTNLSWHVASAIANGPEDECGVGEAVYFVSGELKSPELVSRQAGILAGVPAEVIEGDREMRPDEVDRLKDAQDWIRGMPIVIDDNRGRQFSIAEIEARVREAQQRFAAGTYTTRDGTRYPRNRLRFVVVDYLTKMKPPPKPNGERYNSREQEVAAISSALTELAKTLDVHVFVIAAVSRGDNKNKAEAKKRELHMSDLRESGMIEYDAASIIFANAPADGIIRLRTDKQRFRQAGNPVELVMVGGRISEAS